MKINTSKFHKTGCPWSSVTERPMPEDYAPYHKMPEFDAGITDYMEHRIRQFDGVAGQAYDRGAEYAMRVCRFKA